MEETDQPFLVRTFKEGTGKKMIWWPFERPEWLGDVYDDGHPAYARCHAKHGNNQSFHVDVAWEHAEKDTKGHEFFSFLVRPSPKVRSPSPVKAAKKQVAKLKRVAKSPNAKLPDAEKKIMAEEEENEAYGAETGSEADVDERNSNKSATAETWTGPPPERTKRESKPRVFFG